MKLLRNTKIEGQHTKITNFEQRSVADFGILAVNLVRISRRIQRLSYFAIVSV